MTKPWIACFQKGDTLIRGKALFIIPTSKEPNRSPDILPVPPVILTPPITQADITIISNPVAVSFCAEEYMKQELEDPKYDKMELVTIVYGDDLREKSYNEAMGLFKSYPNLKGIISPTTVGIGATGNAITDADLIGKVHLTGLGLPSEMAEWIKNGACEAMFLWNPIDLGFLTGHTAALMVKGEIEGKLGEAFTAGRMGEKEIVDDGAGGLEIMLGPPFRFDASNIDEWKDVY
jgi:rhamnose transport system substrate-binding protein